MLYSVVLDFCFLFFVFCDGRTHARTILFCPVLLCVFCDNNDATTTTHTQKVRTTNGLALDWETPLAGHEVSLIVSCVVAKHADETAYVRVLGKLSLRILFTRGTLASPSTRPT